MGERRSERQSRAAGVADAGVPVYRLERRFVHVRLAAMMMAGAVLLAFPGVSMARSLRLLALGDSLTAGFGLPEKDSFTVRLEAALHADGVDVNVINAGVSGDTASDALERLDWALGDGADAAIVEVGANDMLRGVDPAATQRAIAAILLKLRDRGVKTLLAGMIAAPGLGHDYEARFNAIYPALAKEFGVPLYAFFLDGVAAQPALAQRDGLHPNAAGVDVIVSRILPSVKALLASVSPR
jgi:acyl-CoA thioesterase I